MFVGTDGEIHLDRFRFLAAPMLWSEHSRWRPRAQAADGLALVVISQIGFDVVAGAVVFKQERVRTWQLPALGCPRGNRAPGAMGENHGGNHRK